MSQINTGNLGDATGSTSTPIADVINGSARAWVNFNGTGTVAIRADYNVDSITDNGTGDYTVNFTNAMPDANYTCTFGSPGLAFISSVSFGLNTAASLQTISAVRTRNVANGAAKDGALLNVAVFR